MPDKTTVYFGVYTHAESPDEAKIQNAGSVNRVIELPTGRGIEGKSIPTNSYSLYSQYYWSDSTGEQRINGYNVTTTMPVQDQSIEEPGKLLCLRRGGNQSD